MPWENSRPTHVPTALREACLRRDGYRCTVEQQDGTRCPETTQLEAAHLGRFRRNERIGVEQLTTKCHWHHNIETQKQARAARGPYRDATKRPAEKHPAMRRAR